MLEPFQELNNILIAIHKLQEKHNAFIQGWNAPNKCLWSIFNVKVT